MTIERETFCIYCQSEKGTPEKLTRHLTRTHPGTYADVAMRRAAGLPDDTRD